MQVIREARIGDEDRIARVHVAAWRAAYRGMMPDAFLDALDEDARAKRWRERLETKPEGRRVVVAIEDETIVGFAGVGPARDETRTRGELYMINVAPSAWGRGIASALLTTCVNELAAFGHHEAILWVLRQNARARRFYQREGWTQEGDRRDTISENGFSFEVDELRYVRALPHDPRRGLTRRS
jgi:RimJ/RimL family protein N-acetyltransferase